MFRKKVSQCRKKLEGRTLWWKNIFRKNPTMPKGGPFGIFKHPLYSKTSKNERWPSEKKIQKESHNAKQNWKGGPFSLARNCMLREKKEKS